METKPLETFDMKRFALAITLLLGLASANSASAGILYDNMLADSLVRQGGWFGQTCYEVGELERKKDNFLLKCIGIDRDRHCGCHQHSCCEPAPAPCCQPAPAPCCEPAPCDSCCGRKKSCLDGLFSGCHKNRCCEPAPAPCCEPAPAPCCEPAPACDTCCKPRKKCCLSGLFSKKRSHCGGCDSCCQPAPAPSCCGH